VASLPPLGTIPSLCRVHKTIRMAGQTLFANFAPGLFAEALGEPAKDNITIEFVPMRTPDQLAALSAKRVDVLVASPTAAFFNALASGADFRIVAQGSLYPGTSGEGFYVNNSFMAAQPPTVALMRGQTVAGVIGVGSPTSEPLFAALEKAGVPYSEVSFRQMNSPDILVALENGAINIGYLNSPFWSKADANKVTRILRMPDYTLGSWIYGETLLREDRALGEAFFRGITRVTRKYLQGDWWNDPHVAEVAAKELQVPLSAITETPQVAFDPAMTYPPGLTDRIQKAYLATPGVLTYSQPIPEDKVVDRSFADKVN
jgi:NitT/TauT family transport system substrate-binding protein